MRSAELDETTFAVRLDPGEEIHAALGEFCAEWGVANGTVQGIGSVIDPTLGYFSLAEKRLVARSIQGAFEIASLTGNIGLVDGQPAAHLHITLSDEQMQVVGGHLVAATCSATVELTVQKFVTGHSKALDPEIGLKVWQI